jgi:hypothetical protein
VVPHFPQINVASSPPQLASGCSLLPAAYNSGILVKVSEALSDMFGDFTDILSLAGNVVSEIAL